MYHVLASELIELSGYQNDQLELDVQPALSLVPGKLLDTCRGKQALVVRNITKVNRELIAGLEEQGSVKVIGRLGTGLDNIDVPLARAAGIEVVYAPTANTESTAEYIVGQILQVTRHLSEAHRSTSSGEWSRFEFLGRQLSELTIGILGYGQIGARLAEILSSFGAKVQVTTRSPQKVPTKFAVVSREQLFSSCDVVSINLSLNESTRGLVGDSLLTLMKPHAILINASRGEIVVERDLERFLSHRPDVTAVLDVRESEPPQTDTLDRLSNVVLSPHIGAFTREAQRLVVATVLDDVTRFLKGKSPMFPAP